MDVTYDRRWVWLGGTVAVAFDALAWGVPLVTLLSIAALLACPTAMLFGMGAMCRMQGAQTADRAAAEARPRERGVLSTPSLTLPARDGDAEETATAHEAIAILKRRLAQGDIRTDEYDRLMAIVSAPAPVAPSAAMSEGR
jgi:hypothetical protein